MKYQTLAELTGQESGAIMFPGNTMIICNWANAAPYGGIPALFAEELITVDPSPLVVVEEEEFTGSVEQFIPETCELIYDRNGDGESLLSDNLTGKVFRLEGGETIIAPRGWN